MEGLTVASPRSQGISSGAVLRFLRQVEAAGMELHSFLLLKSGKLVSEVYYSPFGRDTLHRMYSITKSFTSLAVGILADEGRLSLDDGILSHFPEYAPQNPPAWLRSATLRDLLSMQSCHVEPSYNADLSANWVKSFFVNEPTHPPGRLFNYDTSASHTLGALVEKITGMGLLDFLREKCLDETGFSKNAYIIPDAFGVPRGGSGLMATSLDLARLAQLLLNGGKWQGKQLLPAWYIQEATAKQVSTYGTETFPVLRQGYGYQFWRLPHDGFMCYGMGGQLVMCFPRLELAVITTADVQEIPGGAQMLMGMVVNALLPGLEGADSDGDARELEEYAATAAIQPLMGIKGTRQGTFRYRVEHPFLRAFGFTIQGDNGTFLWEDRDGSVSIPFGMDKLQTGEFPRYSGGLYGASACWESGSLLCMRASLLGEEPCCIRLRAAFGERDCTLQVQNTGELWLHEFTGLYTGTLV